MSPACGALLTVLTLKGFHCVGLDGASPKRIPLRGAYNGNYNRGIYCSLYSLTEAPLPQLRGWQWVQIPLEVFFLLFFFLEKEKKNWSIEVLNLLSTVHMGRASHCVKVNLTLN